MRRRQRRVTCRRHGDRDHAVGERARPARRRSRRFICCPTSAGGARWPPSRPATSTTRRSPRMTRRGFDTTPPSGPSFEPCRRSTSPISASTPAARPSTTSRSGGRSARPSTGSASSTRLAVARSPRTAWSRPAFTAVGSGPGPRPGGARRCSPKLLPRARAFLTWRSAQAAMPRASRRLKRELWDRDPPRIQRSLPRLANDPPGMWTLGWTPTTRPQRLPGAPRQRHSDGHWPSPAFDQPERYWRPATRPRPRRHSSGTGRPGRRPGRTARVRRRLGAVLSGFSPARTDSASFARRPGVGNDAVTTRSGHRHPWSLLSWRLPSDGSLVRRPAAVRHGHFRRRDRGVDLPGRDRLQPAQTLPPSVKRIEALIRTGSEPGRSSSTSRATRRSGRPRCGTASPRPPATSSRTPSWRCSSG